ncbi:carbohydrate ABC transporter permease [Lederbergia lenta]|uniref:Binding-protein-dependent transporters inner membrane component n=1 Tax=Lederbergia lenta TaxID=1467 RepID=A0A2X4X0R0_LEDLE|nr:carbohydrate ABC transporter permease [Lederbergia lenta]MCM3112885.1 carbohydrate ABC transporter permease [Lederbergia lenta]MEC2326148.1 carbohydrate ABC transporter permease [Lederbergia lenta]SQI63550.1 binding-protein-dependent transporters inner membrane component [Lederbergia lenta]
MITQNKTKTYGYIVLGLVLSLFWFYPFYLVIVNSFKTKAEIFVNTLGLPSEGTVENYPQAFGALDFVSSFFNSLIITVSSIFLICICASMAAYALSRRKGRTSSLIYFIFAICMLIPFQSIMIPLISIFGSFDMLNRFGLMIMYLGLASSLSIFLYFGALRGIPIALDEAAIIDGCNRFQVFRYIILPILKPTTVTVIVLNAIWFWNDYLLPSLVINKDGMYTIPLKMFYFFGEYSKQWHLALAALIIAIIPIVVVYMFLQKYIIKGISDGAVK